MARNARRIATPAGAKALMNPRQQQTADMIAEADEHSSSTAESVMESMGAATL